MILAYYLFHYFDNQYDHLTFCLYLLMIKCILDLFNSIYMVNIHSLFVLNFLFLTFLSHYFDHLLIQNINCHLLYEKYYIPND